MATHADPLQEEVEAVEADLELVRELVPEGLQQVLVHHEVPDLVDAPEVRPDEDEGSLRVAVGLTGVPLDATHQFPMVIPGVDPRGTGLEATLVLRHEVLQVPAEPVGLVAGGLETHLRAERLLDQAVDSREAQRVLRVRHLLLGQPVLATRVRADHADQLRDDVPTLLLQEGRRRRRLLLRRLVAEDGEETRDGLAEPHLLDAGALRLHRRLDGLVGEFDVLSVDDGEAGRPVLQHHLDDPCLVEHDRLTGRVDEGQTVEALDVLGELEVELLRERLHLQRVRDGDGGLALGHVAGDVDRDDRDLRLGLRLDDGRWLGGRSLLEGLADLGHGRSLLRGGRGERQLHHVEGSGLLRDLLLRRRLGGRGLGEGVDDELGGLVADRDRRQPLKTDAHDRLDRVQLGRLELRDGGGPDTLHLAQQFENGRGRGLGRGRHDGLLGFSALWVWHFCR